MRALEFQRGTHFPSPRVVRHDRMDEDNLMTGSIPQWPLQDALGFAWRELRLMPLSIADPLAARLPPVLAALRTLYALLEANAAPADIAAAKRAFAKEMDAVVLIARSDAAHETIASIHEGIRDAGTHLADWI
jgi:hypothetical protein